MILVIVESPTKQKTIQKYLRSSQIPNIDTNDAKVIATIGHFRDLASTGKYNLGVDIDSGNFEPTYEIAPMHKKAYLKLLSEAKSADDIYIASDPDREGEAIAWHISQVLNIPPQEAKRLEFHEITRHAIIDSFENVRPIDMNLFHAQEARRIMDRIIGYRLSFLVKDQVGSMKAGRVQSVVLKFIYDNYLERESFVSQKYYNLKLKLLDSKSNNFEVDLVNKDGTKLDIYSQNEIQKIAENLGTNLNFVKLDITEGQLSSPAPFTISKLYQEASRLYHYNSRVVMNALKDLFERGLITYPRTDSIRLAPEFINKAKQLVRDNFGEEYVGVAKIQSKSSGVADAHEALRPTNLEILYTDATHFKDKVKANVYKMIYDRAIKSVMAKKLFKEYKYIFEMNGNAFVYKTNETLFNGFVEYDVKFGNLKQKSEFKPLKIENNCVDIVENEIVELETQKPSLFTEGTIIKMMEDTGVGRPSTYASTLANIIDGGYVEVVNNNLNITKQGIRVADYLEKHFSNTIKTTYTAELESKLDLISSGQEDELAVIKKCNDDFLVEFDYMLKNPDVIEREKTGEKCPKCGRDLIVINYKKDTFIGCSGHPQCNYVKPDFVGRDCPKCGKPLIYKRSKFGKFIACSGFTDNPKCDYTEFIKTTRTGLKKK